MKLYIIVYSNVAHQYTNNHANPLDHFKIVAKKEFFFGMRGFKLALERMKLAVIDHRLMTRAEVYCSRGTRLSNH